ncbi:hypothetical protein NQ318_014221 [Aromia moschata]|uniref:C2H2-type domain-containing protein n=1 Tax=Aromia moschata TaxID=1265417 RepID=A0AAV8Z178_9CUCU|nr:hypothetical protein NQ318_014221 [Aromia moschata]
MMEYNELEGCLDIKSEDEIKKEEDGCDSCHNKIYFSIVPSDENELKPFAEKSYNRETNHRIIESGLYQDVKSALNQETNVMGYHELEECLDIKSEGEVKKEVDECDGDIPHDDTEIKPFVNNSYDQTNQTTIECVPYENASVTEMGYLKSGELIEGVELITYFCKFCSYEAKLKEDLTKHMLDHKDIPELTTYQCDLCPYKTKWKSSLSRHVRIHQDTSDITTYQCKYCLYKTKWKANLSTHALIHQNASELTTYQCDLCPYKTKWKSSLSRHVRIHQDTSDITTYQCKYCPYKTKWKGYLSIHALIHQNSSELTTYQCDLCPYKTKWKRSLSRHVSIHQDTSDITTYQCKYCPYKTKRKGDLSEHALIHQDASEITTYDCTICSYKTKRKKYLTTHVLIHRDASEVPSYQCKLCPYKTKRKGDLSTHALIHQNASEVTTYQCDLCPYKTKRKGDLSTHALIHQNASEVTTYHCDLCPYKTKWKKHLTRHVLIHRDASEVPSYQCKLCPYKTKRKGSLSTHALIHQNASETKRKDRLSSHALVHHRSLVYVKRSTRHGITDVTESKLETRSRTRSVAELATLEACTSETVGDDASSGEEEDGILAQSDSDSEENVSEDESESAEPTPSKRGRPSFLRSKSGFTWSLSAPTQPGRESGASSGAIEHTPAPKDAALHVKSALEAWSLLFTDDMLEIIVIHTNKEIDKYVTRTNTTDPQYTKRTDRTEIRAYIGLSYYAGLFKVNNTRTDDLWSVHAPPLFRAAMTQRRYKFLAMTIRFDDKSTRQERLPTDRFAHVRRVWDMFISNCREYYTPGDVVTLDKQLLSFRGRCGFKMYMPAKPDGYGIKIVSLNDAERII